MTRGASVSSPAEELVGSLVDNRYKILEAMASGSMGAVFRAEREPVGKIVAIKFLHASYANDAEFLGRFERETRVMSKLAHPNCVSVVDFGVWEGSPYLVMEYVAGKTLRTIIDQAQAGGGALAPQRALGIARQITAGLAHAHAQGITHRDIKPANIMITEEIGAGEHVRILDFGLARLRGAVGRDATQTNVVVGTPNYMAPEQTVGGGIIDARTDVYAVGVVLFEMIAGERPFQAEDTLALLGMHRAAPIPRLEDRIKGEVDLPDGIQEVIEKAMAKVPGDRYQSAIELAAAIDELTGVRASTTADTKVHIAPKKLDTFAVAPTMVDIGSSKIERSGWQSYRPSSRAGAYLVFFVLVGGVVTAWYLKSRDDNSAAHGHSVGGDPPITGSAVVFDPGPTPGSASTVDHGSSALPVPDDAAALVTSNETGSGSDTTHGGSGELPDPGHGSNEPNTLPIGVGSAEPVGSAGSNAEIDMAPDPATAPNPVPSTAAKQPDDEAPDAPATNADIEKRAPATPQQATSIEGAVALIKANKPDTALASLRHLWVKNSNSAYIPFLLGNLYFDKRWWSVAMDHYRAAIGRNADYRRNPTLNRNIIRMLGSKKTSGKAEFFIRRTIGRNAALPYLQMAARSDQNPVVKRYATALARSMR